MSASLTPELLLLLLAYGTAVLVLCQDRNLLRISRIVFALAAPLVFFALSLVSIAVVDKLLPTVLPWLTTPIHEWTYPESLLKRSVAFLVASVGPLILCALWYILLCRRAERVTRSAALTRFHKTVRR